MTKAENTQNNSSLKDIANLRIPIGWFFAFSAFVIATVIAILPAYSEYQKSQIEKILKEKSDSDARNKAELTRLETIISFQKQNIESKTLHLKIIEENLFLLRQNNLFYSKQNPINYPLPYPKGLDKIQIGDDKSLIDKVFKGSVDKTNKSYWMVESKENPYYKDITYYFSKETGQIIRILFHLNYKNYHENDFIRDKLVSLYGKPFANLKENSIWILSIPKPINIEHGEGTYILSERNDYPAWLLEGIEDKQIILPPIIRNKFPKIQQ